MVGSQGKQQTVDHQDVLEVVYDTLAVEEVHGGAEEVPIQRLGEAQAAGLAGHVCDCDDLLKGYDLDRRDDDDYEEMAGAEGPEEASNHDEGPCCARYEVGLLLLVLGLGGLFGGLALSAGETWAEDCQRTRGAASSLMVGLPGSLYSDMLCEGLRALPLLALRTWWLNLTSFLGRAMVKGERAVAPGSRGRYRGSRGEAGGEGAMGGGGVGEGGGVGGRLDWAK